jgi:8-oxo-dGTP diphosphatase
VTPPARPIVGVGAVVVHEGRVLLIQRDKEPLRGRWLVPGGTVELGETLQDAVVREVFEETALRVSPREVVLVFDRIERDGPDVRYHYVIVDYVCDLEGGVLAPGSDARAAAWVAAEDLPRYDVPPQALELILRVLRGRGPVGAGDGAGAAALPEGAGPDTIPT